MKPLIFIFFALYLGIGCTSTSTSLKDYQGKRITLANGGGFTGQVIEYVILEDGQVYRKNSMDQSVKAYTKLNKDIVKQIFDNYNVLELNKVELNDPGNMYFYISFADKDEIHKITWNTESTDELAQKAKLFYQTVLNRIKK